MNALEALVSAAIQAPSGDNTQPWHFGLNADDGHLVLSVDPQRDRSPMNSGQRMARIAVGAALENILRMAERHGWEVELEMAASPARAVIRLGHTTMSSWSSDPVIASRVTNRRPYDGRPVAPEILAKLIDQTPSLDGVQTCWITDRQRLTALADLIGRADALMFGESSMRQAFLSQVRFDAAANAPVEQGLPLAALEVGMTDRLALRTMRWLPDWLLKLGGALRVFAAKARQMVESASGLCLVLAPDDGQEQTDFHVGRAMQRAWLGLTAQGLAAQPMMSLAVLDNALQHGDSVLAALGKDRVQALLREFQLLVPNVGQQRLGFLLRFGWAAAPSGRTGRLSQVTLHPSVTRETSGRLASSVAGPQT